MSKHRNPQDPQRRTAANARKTEERIATYYGLAALLKTWEAMDDETQIREHDYLIRLRAKVRMNANLLAHRSGPDAMI